MGIATRICLGGHDAQRLQNNSKKEHLRMNLLTSILSVIIAIVGASGIASAGPIIATPAGLNPGDHFRIVFVTDTTTTASDSNLNTYDNLVTTDANGATYNGQAITWQAIVSSSSVNAINRIQEYDVPVYLADGTKVADSDTSATNGLWSTTLENPINEDLSHTPITALVWTGTGATGFAFSGNEIGSEQPSVGSTIVTYAAWATAGFYDPSYQYNLYGISSELTVLATVPEPSTAMLAGLGIFATAICGYRRQKNISTIV